MGLNDGPLKACIRSRIISFKKLEDKKKKILQIALPLVLAIITVLVVSLTLTQCGKKEDANPIYATVSVKSSLCEEDNVKSWLVNSYTFRETNESKVVFSNPANFEMFDASWYIQHEYTIKNIGEKAISYTLTMDTLQNVNYIVTWSIGEQEEEFVENLTGSVESKSELKIIIYLRIVNSTIDANFDASFNITLTK